MTTRLNLFTAILVTAPLLSTACGGSRVQATETTDPAPILTIYTPRDKDSVAMVVGRFVARFPQYEGKVNVITMSAQFALTRLRA
jgi:iron(III) transport system substrate-binding protein